MQGMIIFAMGGGMVASSQYLEILEAVIIFDTIDVMNDLAVDQGSAEMTRHDEPVLSNV